MPPRKAGDQILVHIGGCKNPLVDSFPKSYLDIISELVEAYIGTRTIKITGGNDAINYLNTRKKKKNIEYISLKHENFVDEISKSAHFVTNGGQTAVLEAFSIGIPTSFLLPMNLSQKALIDTLKSFGLLNKSLNWENYVRVVKDINVLSEKEAISEIISYSINLILDNQSFQILQQDFLSMIETPPDTIGQERFIKYIGTSGAEEIASTIMDKYSN